MVQWIIGRDKVVWFWILFMFLNSVLALPRHNNHRRSIVPSSSANVASEHDISQNSQMFREFRHIQKTHKVNHHKNIDTPSSAAVEGHLRNLLPLLRQSNPLSLSILFSMLIWRLYVAYDFLGKNVGGFITVARGCTSILLAANILGLGATIMFPVAAKNYLKLILALNIIREWMSTIINMKNCFYGRYLQRDVSLGRLIMNFWVLGLCYSYRNSRWVPKITRSMRSPDYIV